MVRTWGAVEVLLQCMDSPPQQGSVRPSVIVHRLGSRQEGRRALSVSGKCRRRSPFRERARSPVGREGSNPESLEGHQELRCCPESVFLKLPPK